MSKSPGKFIYGFSFPKEWDSYITSQICNDIYSGGTPSRAKKEYYENGNIYWVKSGEIRNEIIEEAEEKINELGLKNSSAKIFPPETVLFALYGQGPTAGRVAFINKPMASNQACLGLICNKKIVHFKYLFYYFQLIYSRIRAQRYYGAQPNFSAEFVKLIKIVLPSIKEQYKITAILTNVDGIIQQTQAIRNHLTILKKGLMQQLLTKGTRHTEFQDMKRIGKIPKNWKVTKIMEIIEDYQQGFASGARDEDGIIQLRMNNINTDGQVLLDTFLKVPIPKNIEKYLLERNDILFNNTNSIELIGKTAIFKNEFEYCTFSNHLTRLRVDKSKVLLLWMLYQINQAWRLNYFRRICNRHVNQAGIKRGDIENFKLPLPPIEEQTKITKILTNVDEEIKNKDIYIGIFRKIKRGLMQVLLTGKKRVPLS